MLHHGNQPIIGFGSKMDHEAGDRQQQWVTVVNFNLGGKKVDRGLADPE